MLLICTSNLSKAGRHSYLKYAIKVSRIFSLKTLSPRTHHHKILIIPGVHYSSRVPEINDKQVSLKQQLQNERRDCLLPFNQDTKVTVLKQQFDLPFIKLIAIEGAKQSPLQIYPADRKYSNKHEGVRYKVLFIDDMLLTVAFKILHQKSMQYQSIFKSKVFSIQCICQAPQLGCQNCFLLLRV